MTNNDSAGERRTALNADVLATVYKTSARPPFSFRVRTLSPVAASQTAQNRSQYSQKYRGPTVLLNSENCESAFRRSPD